jgi:hypothetical protein
MDTNRLIGKIERMRAAIGVAQDKDLGKYPPKIVQTANMISMSHDFSGGLTQAEIENMTWAVIRAISDLYDHLRKWARANGHNKDAVDGAVRGSFELALVIDLANFDKHGGHDRDGGKTGASPLLENIRRAVRMRTEATPGAMAGVRLTPTGIQPIGDPKGLAVIVTGDIKLKDGRALELEYVQTRAMEAWEQLLAQFGVTA